MTTTTQSSKKARTDPRPRYIDLGADSQGGIHVYRTVDETVFALAPDGDLEYRFDVEGIPVGDYVAHVTDTRGWDCRRFGRDVFLDRLAEAV